MRKVLVQQDRTFREIVIVRWEGERELEEGQSSAGSSDLPSSEPVTVGR